MVSMKPQHQEGNTHLAFYFIKTAITVKVSPCQPKPYGVQNRESRQA